MQSKRNQRESQQIQKKTNKIHRSFVSQNVSNVMPKKRYENYCIAPQTLLHNIKGCYVHESYQTKQLRYTKELVLNGHTYPTRDSRVKHIFAA